MKKIKFLHATLVVILILSLLKCIQLIQLAIKSDVIVAPDFYSVIMLMLSLLKFIGLLLLERGLYTIIKNGYFNQRSKKAFRSSGLIFIVSGIFLGTLDLIYLFLEKQQTNHFYSDFGEYTLLVLIGFGLMVLSDILKIGTEIKTENDLTI